MITMPAGQRPSESRAQPGARRFPVLASFSGISSPNVRTIPKPMSDGWSFVASSVAITCGSASLAS